MKDFTHTLLSECLFADFEQGTYGAVSLYEMESKKEVYFAAFDEEDGTFMVEKGTDWATIEDYDEDDEAAALTLAVDGTIILASENVGDIATKIIELAEAENLGVSYQILYEEQES